MDRLHAFPAHKVIHKWIKLESSRRKHKGSAAALNVNKGVLMDSWSMWSTASVSVYEWSRWERWLGYTVTYRTEQ